MTKYIPLINSNGEPTISEFPVSCRPGTHPGQYKYTIVFFKNSNFKLKFL